MYYVFPIPDVYWKAESAEAVKRWRGKLSRRLSGASPPSAIRQSAFSLSLTKRKSRECFISLSAVCVCSLSVSLEYPKLKAKSKNEI
jgi:hypothetical protein